MSFLTTPHSSPPPVSDPLLRGALRRLYPEVPTWLRRWLILPPTTPPPTPSLWGSPHWADTDAAHQSVVATRDTLRQRHPKGHWRAITSQDGDSTRTSLSCRATHDAKTMAPPGSPIYFKSILGYVTQIETAQRAGVARWSQRGYGLSLNLSLPHDLPLGSLSIRWSGARHASDTPPPSPTSPIERVDRFLQFDGINELLADGSPATIMWGIDSRRVVRTIERDPPIDPNIERLVARWSALTSPEDRQRIGAFWLGHPHPTLAAAGLAVVSQTPHHRRAHGS